MSHLENMHTPFDFGSGGEQKHKGRTERSVPKRENPREYTTGEFMRMARQESGITQGDMAQRVGKTKSHLNSAELGIKRNRTGGKFTPSRELVEAYERETGSELGELFGADRDKIQRTRGNKNRNHKPSSH